MKYLKKVKKTSFYYIDYESSVVPRGPEITPVLCMAAHNVADPVCGTLFVDLDWSSIIKNQGRMYSRYPEAKHFLR